MNRQTGLAALTALALAAGHGAGLAQAGDLSIEIEGLRSDSGRVYVGVFSPTRGFDFPQEEGMILGGWWLAEDRSVRVTWHGLPDGEYAVTAYHDENGNDQFDRNVLGLPTEGYGFSNDAPVFMGPPKFDDAAVTVSGDSVTSILTIRY